MKVCIPFDGLLHFKVSDSHTALNNGGNTLIRDLIAKEFHIGDSKVTLVYFDTEAGFNEQI